MRRVSLGGDDGYKHEPIEVDLWGRVFLTKSITRSVKKELADLTDRLMLTDDSDELAELYGQMVDAITVPTNGQKKKASQIMLEMWKAEKLSDPELADFAERLQEELSRPPTRTPN